MFALHDLASQLISIYHLDISVERDMGFLRYESAHWLDRPVCIPLLRRGICARRRPQCGSAMDLLFEGRLYFVSKRCVPDADGSGQGSQDAAGGARLSQAGHFCGRKHLGGSVGSGDQQSLGGRGEYHGCAESGGPKARKARGDRSHAFIRREDQIIIWFTGSDSPIPSRRYRGLPCRHCGGR